MTIKSVMFLPDQQIWILVEGILQSVEMEEETIEDYTMDVCVTRVDTIYEFDVQFKATQYYVVTEEWVRKNYPDQMRKALE